MPSYRIDRARRFLDRLIALPLFGQIGEPLDGGDYICVTSVPEYEKAMRVSGWSKLIGTNALNHHSARIIDVYGMDWFQNRNNDEVERIREELDKRNVEREIKKAWRSRKIPANIDPYIDTEQWAYNFVTFAAYDQALGFADDDTFDSKYVVPCLLLGHLPCGWSDRIPAEPKSPRGVSPYSGKPLEIATGNGKLKVF
jgi:hypothetical protein